MPDLVLDLIPVPGQSDKLFVKRSGSTTLYRVNKSVFNSSTPGGGKSGAFPTIKDPSVLDAPPSMDDDLGPEDMPPDLSKAEDVKANKG